MIAMDFHDLQFVIEINKEYCIAKIECQLKFFLLPKYLYI